MNDKISVFPKAEASQPVGETTWQEALQRIQSDRYQKVIEKARSFLPDIVQYREYKKALPCVTFCGHFPNKRAKEEVGETTGFIIPDLDHIQDVDSLFDVLTRDKFIWFAFRSASGDGIKCGVRANGITTDDDIKKLYYAVENYFKSIYGVKIDPACKDISRLTFVSYDPALWINPDPLFFNIDQWTEKTETPVFYKPTMTGNGWKAKYGMKVLIRCCDEIRVALPGSQHHARLKWARLIGGFIPDYIDESEALKYLESAVATSGAKDMKASMKTITDGIKCGKMSPIEIPERPVESSGWKDPRKDIDFYFDPDDIDVDVSNVSNVSNVQQCPEVSADVSRCQQDVSKGCQNVSNVSRDSEADGGKGPFNLAGHIKEWLDNSTGSFTVDQLDRELCLTTRSEKNNRAKILSRYITRNLVKKDKRVKGKYHIPDSHISLINVLSVKEESFPISLPFGLHENVLIPNKAVIILAGSSNAGKTSLVLNTLKLNLKTPYHKYYLMSEMGEGEYVDRLRGFTCTPLKAWNEIKAAEKASDFHSVIENFNPDGLTCIDFLEEVDGEYFRIPSNIREIYDALGKGVAFIAVQKKTTEQYARGGEGTAEKARLYMTVDYLATQESAIVCALKLVKVKRYIGQNLQNHEIHFRITKGAQIEALTDWMPCGKIDRSKMAAIYESGRTVEDVESRNYAYTFTTTSGKFVGVNYEQRDKWIKEFGYFVDDALFKMQEDSKNKPFLRDKWFFQVAGLLAKQKDRQQRPQEVGGYQQERADIYGD